MPSLVDTIEPIGHFRGALQRAQSCRYSDTEELAGALDAYVHSLRMRGSSWEEAIDEVSACARRISPLNAAPTESSWEDEWRRYYGLYDTLIQRAIRTYVLHSQEAWSPG